MIVFYLLLIEADVSILCEFVFLLVFKRDKTIQKGTVCKTLDI